jgi:hypothetical protein
MFNTIEIAVDMESRLSALQHAVESTTIGAKTQGQACTFCDIDRQHSTTKRVLPRYFLRKFGDRRRPLGISV